METPDFENSSPNPEVMIRTAINRRRGQVTVYGTAEEKQELAEREKFIQVVLRLHQIGIGHTPACLHRPVRETEVNRAASVLRRISLVRSDVGPDDLMAYCADRTAQEIDIRARLADPFQLRHLLTFHNDIPHEELNSIEIFQLRTACELHDQEALREWYLAIGAKKDALPRDTPAYLRHMILEQVVSGNRTLEAMAFEQAVLDVRLFGILGWENTRLFYALLKLIGGTTCPAFTAYLTEEEIGEAIRYHEMLRNEDQVAHFRELRATHRPRGLLNLEKSIFALARQRDDAQPAPVPAAAPRRSTFSGLLRLIIAPATA